MQIGELAAKVDTTTHAIRWYERRGLLPRAKRTESGYREYSEQDASRLRLLVGLRSLDLPLEQAAELASLCAAGQCGQVSDELRAAIADKRREIARRADELGYLDHRLAHLAGELEAGKPPRPLITIGKERRQCVLIRARSAAANTTAAAVAAAKHRDPGCIGSGSLDSN